MTVANELQALLEADCKRTFLTRKQRQTVRKAMNTVETLAAELKETNSRADFFEGQAALYEGMADG